MSFDELSKSVREVVTEAINAEMLQTAGFRPDGSGGFHRARQGVKMEKIPGPGQGPTGPIQRSPNAISGPMFNPTVDVYEKWERDIPPMFDPWMILPDPTKYKDHIHAVNGAAAKLCVNGAEVDKKEGSTHGYHPPNQALNSAVDTAAQKLALFSGATVNLFHQHYVNNFKSVAIGQYHVARMLLACLASEQEIWTRSRADIVRIAVAARDALRNVAKGGGDFDAKLFIDVVGSIATVAGLFFSAGTAGVVVKGVNAAASVLGKFVPKNIDTMKHLQLAGGSAAEVIRNMEQAMRDLSTAIAGQEDDIITKLKEVESLVDTNVPAFDLGRPTLLDETDPTKVVTNKNELSLDPNDLVWIGKSLLPTIAGELHAAARGLDPFTSSSDWSRSGKVGRAYDGPRDDFYRVSDRLHDFVAETAKEMQDAGDTLVIVAKAFHQTDAQVSEEMRRHRDAVNVIPAPSNNPDPGDDHAGPGGPLE
jgi:hypothetical protein